MVAGDPGCGGTFTDTDGIIISPNWPNDYAHNRQCVYVIRLPAGEKVSLNFTHLSLENHSSCSFDYVEVGPDPGRTGFVKSMTMLLLKFRQAAAAVAVVAAAVVVVAAAVVAAAVVVVAVVVVAAVAVAVAVPFTKPTASGALCVCVWVVFANCPVCSCRFVMADLRRLL